MILTIVTWIGAFLAVLFSILALASGLYYLVELVEEHTVLAQKCIRYSLQSILVLHILVWLFERIQFTPIASGLAAHAIYALLLNEFPQVSITSPLFLLSCVMVLVNHFSWFYYFSYRFTPFPQVASVFGVLVWLVPFMFFVSLSANEMTLPNYDANGKPKRKSHIIKRALDGLLGRGSATDKIDLPANVDRRTSQLMSPMDAFISPMETNFPNNPVTQRRY